MKKSHEISYDWIETTIRAETDRLRKEKISHVVAILRGGTVPGFISAQILDASLHFLKYDRTTREVKFESSAPPQGAKLLLVDDIAGEGYTLFDAKVFLEMQGYSLKLLTIGFDERSRLKPDFGVDLSGQIMIFPWERHRLNPNFVSDLSTQTFGKDQSYEKIAIDLDGILLADLPETDYHADLQATLKRRDALPPHPKELYPPFNAENAILITSRPLQDKPRTREWLDRNGFQKFTVYHRDDTKLPHSQAARFKAMTAREIGITKFYESDLLQATLITHHCPLLDVFYWNNDRRERIRLGPSRLLEL